MKTVLVLNRTYANRANAERAAKMQWERLQRGVTSFSLQLAEGRADLYTEMPVRVQGFKKQIDEAEWTITWAHIRNARNLCALCVPPAKN